MTTRVLIVEDMATYRTIIARCLSEIEGVEVVGRASNGQKALEFLETNEVDFITLDVEMPVMDGLATLKELRNRRINVDVVMLSGLSEQAAQLTIQCLELGAVDFVLKPQTASFVENQNQLVQHLKSIMGNVRRKSLLFRRRSSFPPPTPAPSPPSHGASPRPNRPSLAERAAAAAAAAAASPPAPSAPARPAPRKSSLGLKKPKVLLIGVSTGGPRALATVFENLKGPLPFPIMIVQHMPPKFTKSLADSLDKKGTIPVVEAADGDVLEHNKAYIAPGGYHMCIERDEDFGLVVALNQDPPVNSCRPSVDVLFNSVVPLFQSGDVVALIMTGMGRDGADGAEALSRAGAFIGTQSEDSCTIYGMPKAVEDLAIQDEVFDLDDIAPFIIKLARRSF